MVLKTLQEGYTFERKLLQILCQEQSFVEAKLSKIFRETREAANNIGR